MADRISSCATCGVEYAHPLPETCPICHDERQWVPSTGQAWTTLAELGAAGQGLTWSEGEPGRHVVTTEPTVGIGHSMQVVDAVDGLVLWDPPGYIDDETVTRIRRLGPVLGIATSHPHMFGVQVEWGHALDAPVLVNEADAQWLGRPDASIRFWRDEEQLGSVTLHQIGGHFAGSAVALWPAGAGGRGTLLTGDTVFPNPDGWSVGFLRSYPNKIPLSAAVVQRIADDLGRLRFDAVIGNFDNRIASGGHDSIRRSAERHIAWVRGDHDDLT
ncbi:MAG TPA: hydrolase [Terrimesophilobacter sp.]|nr:hydrolase [Terrimesophilobacter sp.]